MKKVLTIAGSDSSGGAGVQADLKTMLANGVYGMSAITALTAQNTQGVRMVQEATPEFLAAELDAVFEDIRPDAVKVGMVASPALIRVIAEKLQGYGAEHVVVDPVMVATSGAKLLADDAVEVLVQELFPLAEVITPNLPELSVLTGQEIADEAAFQRAAEHLAAQAGVNVLAKGGDSAGEATCSSWQTARGRNGTAARASRIPTRTARAARSRARLRQTSPKVSTLRSRLAARSPICSGRCWRRWTSARAAAPSIMDGISMAISSRTEYPMCL